MSGLFFSYYHLYTFRRDNCFKIICPSCEKGSIYLILQKESMYWPGVQESKQEVTNVVSHIIKMAEKSTKGIQSGSSPIVTRSTRA